MYLPINLIECYHVRKDLGKKIVTKMTKNTNT